MKAERRHELQTNMLADYLAQGLERYRPYLPTIAWGAAAAVAVLVAVIVWTSREGSSAAKAWEEFDQIQYVDAKARPKRLKELADRYAGTDVAIWARLDLADQLCVEGREKLAFERGVAETYLKEAQQTYAAVLQNPNVRPDMIRRAALAEAKCWELLGEREKAISTYRAVAEKYKNILPLLAADAASRASDLDSPDAADFYKWFAEYTPPAAPSLNLPGLGPSFPPLDGEAPKSEGKSEPAGEGADNSAPSPPPGESSSEKTTPKDPPASPPQPSEKDAKPDPSGSPE